MRSIRARQPLFYDKYLLFAVLALIAIGFLMVTSTSMAISERRYDGPFYYFFRQGAYLLFSSLVAFCVMHIKMTFWEKMRGFILLSSVVLLIIVIIPGIGRQVNGSTRWLGIGSFTLQVSEFAKLAIIIYLSGFLVKHQKDIRTEISVFLKPMILLGMISFLLLLEPDFGAIVVIMITALSMMYLAGARLWQFGVLFIMVLIGLSILAISSPYRLLRLTSFLNPWDNQFGSGYQLTQSLIAFGRGGLFGVGLGSSVQKLFYLPEAHTDFLYAVLGEELGLLGIVVVIGLYFLLVIRALLIGRRALSVNRCVPGYMAYGIAVWLGIQAFVNMGVNAGLLPTKGLTLPLISYGGSSMLIVFVATAILFRIDRETFSHNSRVASLRKSVYHKLL